MAETVLVRPELTPRMIEGGRTLLASLDQHGVPIEAGFWLLDEEVPVWHLVFSSPQVRKDGSRPIYHKIGQLIERLGLSDAVWVGVVSIIDPRTPIVQALTATLGKAASVDGARLDDARIGRLRLPGCLLYRLSRRQRIYPNVSGNAAAE